MPVYRTLSWLANYLAAELGQPIERTPFWLDWAALCRADFSCSVSRYVAHRTEQLFGLRGDTSVILYNSVDLPSETFVPARSRNKIVFAGGVKVNKGILSVMLAWPRVITVDPTGRTPYFWKGRLTDDGRSMQACVLSQLDSQIAKSVHFQGFGDRRQISHALQTARLAVFPSYAEAFALAPMEVMACGCPTVYTRRTSGPELKDHNQNGWLVDPGQPHEIADAIIRLLADDDLAKRFGDAGRRRIEENFSTGAMVSQNEAFYRDCVSDIRSTHMRRNSLFSMRDLRSVFSWNRDFK